MLGQGLDGEKKGGADGHKVTGVISAERRRRRGAEGEQLSGCHHTSTLFFVYLNIKLFI